MEKKDSTVRWYVFTVNYLFDNFIKKNPHPRNKRKFLTLTKEHH